MPDIAGAVEEVAHDVRAAAPPAKAVAFRKFRFELSTVVFTLVPHG